MLLAKMAKILVVDDNAAFSELVQMLFEGEHEVRTAEDGEKGLSAVTEFKPDLILLDIMIPKRSGVEILKTLQSHSSTESIPVVMVTAADLNPVIQEQCEQQPSVRAFLKKPCELQALRALVEKLL